MAAKKPKPTLGCDMATGSDLTALAEIVNGKVINVRHLPRPDPLTKKLQVLLVLRDGGLIAAGHWPGLQQPLDSENNLVRAGQTFLLASRPDASPQINTLLLRIDKTSSSFKILLKPQPLSDFFRPPFSDRLQVLFLLDTEERTDRPNKANQGIPDALHPGQQFLRSCGTLIDARFNQLAPHLDGADLRVAISDAIIQLIAKHSTKWNQLIEISMIQRTHQIRSRFRVRICLDIVNFGTDNISRVLQQNRRCKNVDISIPHILPNNLCEDPSSDLCLPQARFLRVARDEECNYSCEKSANRSPCRPICLQHKTRCNLIHDPRNSSGALGKNSILTSLPACGRRATLRPEFAKRVSESGDGIYAGHASRVSSWALVTSNLLSGSCFPQSTPPSTQPPGRFVGRSCPAGGLS